MKQAYTRSDAVDDRAMGLRFACVDRRDESPGSIRARRHPEASPEGTGEHFVAAETARQRDAQHRLAPGQQQPSRPAETESQAELLWGLSSRSRKHPMQLKRR